MTYNHPLIHHLVKANKEKVAATKKQEKDYKY